MDVAGRSEAGALTNRIRALALVGAVIALGALAPLAHAGKKADKLPRADFALAVFEQAEGRVGIAVKVENATSVTVVYNGATREAVNILPAIFWWSVEFNGGPQDCYRIVVRARNQHGTISRQLGAGRLGTAGCSDCGDAEQAVARAHHKVKHARAALRRADSPSERRAAKRRLAKAKKRLARADQRLQACLA